jgi:hypothetical protein
VLWWPTLLAVAPDLIGFGQAKIAKRALVLTFGSAAPAALTGAGLPAAMICPELGPLDVGQDVFEKPVAALTTAHGGSAKSSAILPQSAMACDKKSPISQSVCGNMPRPAKE